MDSHWNDNQPIYRQLRDRVYRLISMLMQSRTAEAQPAETSDADITDAEIVS